MDIETVDEYRAKWVAANRNGTDEALQDAWDMLVLAIDVYEQTTNKEYVRPYARLLARQRKETPNDT